MGVERSFEKEVKIENRFFDEFGRILTKPHPILVNS
jgi:hypothetical protein